MGFLSKDAVVKLGFKHVGKEVSISEKASFYNTNQISIGNNVRIDDFAILSAGEGGIYLGDYVHIACYSSLIGKGRIEMEDFAGVAGRVSVYSSNEDYSGSSLTHPSIPYPFRKCIHSDVIIRKNAIVGAGSVVLPGVEIKRGSVVGALSLVKADCEELGMYLGVPCRRIGNRNPEIFDLYNDYIHN